MFCKLYDLSFKVVCKYLCSKETYDILEKYDCFEIIDRLNNYRCIDPCDSIDIALFLRGLKITRIIKDGKEIVFEDTPFTCMILVDYNSENIDKLTEKIRKYNEKYLMDGDFLLECYQFEGKEEFVLCGYQDADTCDIEGIKEILDKCDGVK